MIGLNGGLVGRPRSLYANTGIWTPNEQRLSKNDPYWDSVSLLLHMDGANASTTFTDSSKNALTATANGNAQISTAQSKFGGASGSFDGNGDFLTLASSAPLNLSSGNFTIECWVYHSSRPTAGNTQTIIDKDGVFVTSYPSYSITVNSSGSVIAILGNGAGLSPTSTTYTIGTVSLNTWSHIAVVKSGSTITTYLNGTQGSTATQGVAITDGGKSLYVGFYSGAGAASYFNGYIDDLRITKGVARYTANFTPPNAAFPDA